MKILIVGLGSIGRRHARNLRTILGPEAQIFACRSGRVKKDPGEGGPAIPEGIVEFHDLETALAAGPEATFVCNPTSSHLSVALAAARAGSHLFIEKPLAADLAGTEELCSVVQSGRRIAMVGFQFRFHPGLRAVKRLIASGAVGRIVHASASWGEYLPGWHPWEDYRKGYSARPDLGGGVILTLSHPFDYLRWLLGEVRRVSATAGSRGDLGIPVEDCADIALEFASGASATVHLDYLRRPPAHRLEIVGTTGTILWDYVTSEVRCFRADDGDWEVLSMPSDFERNAMFIDEVTHFLDCIATGKQPLIPLEDAVRTQAVILAAAASAVEGRSIGIEQ